METSFFDTAAAVVAGDARTIQMVAQSQKLRANVESIIHSALTDLARAAA